MKIADFENLIRELPYEYQAFDIKYDHWKNTKQSQIIESIFFQKNTAGIITISRFDLFHADWNLEEFIVKVLMWGYPTKGRGNNIDTILLPENFDLLMSKLKNIDGKDNITISEVLDFLQVKGLGFSTLSKILYFKKLRIESLPALVFDQRVINALNINSKFEDYGIERFKSLKYENAFNHYVEYLQFMYDLSTEIKVKPDQIEMFLFEFGSNLKEPVGEDGDWDDL